MFFLLLILTLLTTTGSILAEEIEDIVSFIKENNPQLRIFREEIRKFRYKEIFETSYPDTVFSSGINDIQIFYKPFDRNIEPMQSLYFGLSRRFPYYKKLKTKGEIVLKELSQYRKFIDIKTQEILGKSYRALFKVWLYRKELDILREFENISKNLIKLSNILYSVGKAS